MHTITLGSLPLDMDDFRLLAADFNAPPTEIHEVTSALADKNLQADVRTSAYRDIVISVAVSGSSKQTLISNLKSLCDEIGKESNTLTLQPDGQTDRAVAFAIGRNPEPEIPFDQAFEAGLVAHVTFVLKAEPYAYRPSYPPDVQAPSISAPNLVTFTNLGDRRVPINLVVNSSTAFKSLYLAVVDPSSDVGWYVRKFSSGSPISYEGNYWAPIPDSGAWDGTAVRYDPADSVARWFCVNPDYTPMPNGRYRLLLRARVETGASATVTVADGSILVAFGGDALRAAPVVSRRIITNTSHQLIDFGEIDVPQRALRPAGNGNRCIGFTVSMSDPSKYAYFDSAILIPAESAVMYRPTDGSCPQCFQIAENGVTYVDQYATFAGVTGQRLTLPPGAQKLLAVADTATSSGTKPTLTLTMRHMPRYVLWRSA